MKKIIIGVITSIAILTGAYVYTNEEPVEINDNVPKGWLKAGSNPERYEVGTDKEVFYTGKSSMYIKGVTKKTDGFGTVMQNMNAETYLGKRLKMSGYLRSSNVTGWAGLWMRIDGKGDDSFGFDNMQNRAIKGTSDWKKYEIILDVPKESQNIAFGVLTSGKGTVWTDDIKFEIVDNSVETTDLTKGEK